MEIMTEVKPIGELFKDCFTQRALGATAHFMETKEFRASSAECLREYNVALPNHLPLLDWPVVLRDASAICDRIFCLHAVAAGAYGFDRNNALSWLSNEGLAQHLTGEELAFLKTGKGEKQRFQTQIEAIWGLAWCIRIIPVLDFRVACDNSLAKMMPNLKANETTAALRKKAALRPIDEIGKALDLSYCLHWVLRDGQARGRLQTVHIAPHIIIERRHALEWVASSDSWEGLSLDT